MLCNTYLQRRALDLGNWKKRGLRLSLSRKAGILRFRPSSIAVSEMGDSDGSPVSRDDYYVVDGLRLVKPYHFNFKCRVKERWVGRSVVDVFLSEFPARDREYYEQAVQSGRITVEDTRRGRSWKGGPLDDGQCIRHLIHRHEPPTLNILPEIVAVTESIVAVNKPATLPVHTSGQYRKNTVQTLLEVHHPELMPIYSVHRLDKIVSGVLLFARTSESARNMQGLIMGGLVEKRYVARVLGEFPEEGLSVENYLDWDPKMNCASVLESSDPTNSGDSSGKRKRGPKWSKTDFQCLSIAEDRKTSLVECRPRTGRTHQIRVHLQYLGYPIANDTQYGGTMAKGRPTYEGWRIQGIIDEEDTAATQKRCKTTEASSQATKNESDPPGSSQNEVPGPTESSKDNHKLKQHLKKYPYLVDKEFEDPLCPHCPASVPVCYPVDLEPLWLHAISYSGPDWHFETTMPEWHEEFRHTNVELQAL